MEDLEELRAHHRTIEHLVPLLDAIRSVAEIAWRRANRATTPLERYAERLTPALDQALAGLAADARAGLLAGWSRRGPAGVLVIGSERGLCGPFNERVVAEGLRQADRLAVNQTPVQLLCLGSRAQHQLEVSGRSLLYARPLSSLTVPTYVFTEGVALDVLRLIEDSQLGRLVIVANASVGRFQYQPVTTALLPPDLPTLARDRQRAEIRPPGDESALANHLLTEHLLVGLHRLVIASAVAEQLARIAAMRVAADNARRLLDRLGLESVVAERQAITSELLELVAGYELVRDS